MKIHSYFIVSVLGLAMLNSCTDLAETPYTFVSPDTFYQNEKQLDEALMTEYSAFRNVAGNWQNIMRLEGCTEFAQPSRGPKDNNQNINDWYNVNSANSTGTFSNMWNRCYITINRANTILERGAGITIDESKKKQVFAQARFMRAYCYYYLVRLFGGVPIPRHMTNSMKDLGLGRSSVSETWDYIIADLEYCEINLPAKGMTAYDAFRPTKEAAQTLLGSLYLWRASMENNVEFYTKSAEYNKKVIGSGKFHLLSDYKSLWYMFAGEKSKYNDESIFELAYTRLSGQHNQLHQMFGTFGDSYYNSVGGSYFYLRIGPSIYAYESYADNDIRKQVFVVKGTAKKSSTLYNMEFVPTDKGHYPGSKGWQCCTLGNGKYYDFSAESAIALKSANNWMLLRYSEVLLNYAEALNEMGQTSEALKYLNMVHSRAGLSALTISGKQNVDNAIFQERGWEFIGEAKLYFDELRTNRLGKNIYEFLEKGVKENMYYFRHANFVPKKEFLWKIPQGDLDSNPLLKQNPDNISDPGYPLITN